MEPQEIVDQIGVKYLSKMVEDLTYDKPEDPVAEFCSSQLAPLLEEGITREEMKGKIADLQRTEDEYMGTFTYYIEHLEDIKARMTQNRPGRFLKSLRGEVEKLRAKNI